ncbi:MAG: RagB/SusD family nutrient uptake outer membrane protein [Tannerellaceae bacterium]|nr:RagB/SusD family nutrient uptake outer membrane protein [Tannerellaceae bacterium]
MLDKNPLTEISEDDIWNDPALVESFVNARYNQTGHGWTESMQSSCVDETDLVWGGRGCEPINRGYLSPTDLGRMNGGWYGWDHRSWSHIWTQISNCNIFFERIEEVPFLANNEHAEWKKRMMGEIRFLRVLMYNDLIVRWGAMPLITESYTMDDLDKVLAVRRAGYKDCVEFMISELEQAAKELPASYSGNNGGRATSVAALALKSRILLYAASPLMNDNVESELVGYQNPEADRWEKAAKAAAQAIEHALESGYDLYRKYDDPSENYYWLFLDVDCKEVLFARQGTNSSVGENLSSFDQWNGPNGYGGWGGNCPLQDFVDDFEVLESNGSIAVTFDWNNPMHKQEPFKDRDPRFYATVSYDGSQWQGREIETFFTVDASGNETGGGRDTKYGNDSWNTSNTGYYIRKWMDEEYNQNSWNFPNPKNWIWLRLGEQYLNLAEALYMSGDENGAREALNVIRERAGMPDVLATGSELLEKIKNERRIELCFEEHRYYDVRRWKEAEKYCNKTVTGITINKHPDGTKEYIPGRKVEDRTFHSRMYWCPILRSERDKNPGFAQNPGYTD